MCVCVQSLHVCACARVCVWLKSESSICIHVSFTTKKGQFLEWHEIESEVKVWRMRRYTCGRLSSMSEGLCATGVCRGLLKFVKVAPFGWTVSFKHAVCFGWAPSVKLTVFCCPGIPAFFAFLSSFFNFIPCFWNFPDPVSQCCLFYVHVCTCNVNKTLLTLV